MNPRRPRSNEAPWTRNNISRAFAAATAAVALSLAEGFVVSLPGASDPSLSTPPVSSLAPAAGAAAMSAVTSLFPLNSIAVDPVQRASGLGASRRGFAVGARARGHDRFTSSLGRPLPSSPSSSAGDAGVPEGDDEGRANPGDALGRDPPAAGGMSESERLREKLETIAKTTGPDGDAGGLTREEEEELEEVRAERIMEEELERRAAAQKEKSLDPYLYAADDDEEDDPDSEKYEEIIANMTKPLGITIEQSTDKAQLVYVTSVGEKAEAAGLRVGDVLTGASAVFGGDVWSVKGKNIEEIRSLVRCRTEPYSLIRVERGHVSLEERCAPGFDEEDMSNCWRIPEDMLGENAEECELNPNYANLWAAVYEEEMEVLNGEAAAKAAGVGRGGLFSTGVGGRDQPKRGNEGPPPKDKPGPGAFNGETFNGDSWDSSGSAF